jgi:hypothetical protein
MQVIIFNPNELCQMCKTEKAQEIVLNEETKAVILACSSCTKKAIIRDDHEYISSCPNCGCLHPVN